MNVSREAPSAPTAPAPTPRLQVFVLGEGVGESVIVVFPDDRVLVMDACVHRGVNLPAALLRDLGFKRIDLLVLSHPDLDHVRGFAQLVRDFDPPDVWRYPSQAAIRDFFVRWCRTTSDYGELANALDALDDHQEKSGRVANGAYDSRRWPAVVGSYEVTALAPTHYDQDRALRLFERLLRVKNGRARLTSYFRRLLSGDTRLGDTPSVLSLAVGIRWGDVRILLGGDVLRGARSPHSGWKGVLRLLREDRREAEVTNVALVKVAHHGSKGAFEPELWRLHARDHRTCALMTPFSPSALPDSTTLAALREHADHLGVSGNGVAIRQRLTDVGWVLTPAVSTSTHSFVSAGLAGREVSLSASGNAIVATTTSSSRPDRW